MHPELDALDAADVAVRETVAVAVAGYESMTMRENALLSLLTSFSLTFAARGLDVRHPPPRAAARARSATSSSASATSTTSCRASCWRCSPAAPRSSRATRARPAAGDPVRRGRRADARRVGAAAAPRRRLLERGGHRQRPDHARRARAAGRRGDRPRRAAPRRARGPRAVRRLPPQPRPRAAARRPASR